MLKSNYPATLSIKDREFTFRLMSPDDRNVVLRMAQNLSEKDLLFMRRDITQPDAVDEWIRDIKEAHALSLLVEYKGDLVAYGTLYYNQIFWHRHLGEIRFLVSSPYRNRGIATQLTQELMKFALELGLDKVISYMAANDKGAQRVVEEIGFRPEALLTDWVKTRDNQTHDLVIMSTDLTDLRSG